MNTRNGSARVATHPRRRSRSQEAKASRTHKKTPIDQSNFAEMSAMVMKYLEKTLAGTDKNLMNSQLVIRVISTYLRKYPLTALSSAALVGGVLSFLISRSDLLDLSSSSKKSHYMEDIKDKLLGTADDSLHVMTEVLNFIVMQVKDHSIELYDELVDNFLKKYPLQTTAGALALGVVLTLLIRRE